MYASKITGGCLAVMALLLGSSAFAADDAIDASANGGQTPNVPLVSGGVGEDELNYIKSVEHQYNLKLMFTEANGIFLSDLPVSIRDKQGHTVVSTVTKGPILLVNLPSGAYNIKVSDGGESKEEKISVFDHGQRTFQFRFAGNDKRSDSSENQ